MPDDTLWLTIEGDELWHNTRVYDKETGRTLQTKRVVITSAEENGFIEATITCLVRDVHFSARDADSKGVRSCPQP